jgi:hypothetical protein
MRFQLSFGLVVISLVSWTGLALFPAPAAEPQKHFPSNEEIRQVRTASAPRLSPDGKQVVVEITDSTANGGQNHIWLLPVEGTDFRQLTFSTAAGGENADNEAGGRGGRAANGEHGAEWLPDGSGILYLARSGSTQQIFRLGLDGIAPSPLQLHFAGIDRAPEIQSFAIAPNGKMLAVVARDPEPAGTARQPQGEGRCALGGARSPHPAAVLGEPVYVDGFSRTD